MAEVGAGGITGGRWLAQLFGAYIGLDFLLAQVLSALSHGLSPSGVGAGLLLSIWQIVSLLAVVLGLYFVAQFVRSSTKFGELLTGVVLVRVMAYVALLGLAVVFAFALLLGAIGILPSGMASSFAVLMAIAHAGLMFFYFVFFLIGVFDMGCLGSVFLGLIASFIGSGIEAVLGAMIRAALGG